MTIEQMMLEIFKLVLEAKESTKLDLDFSTRGSEIQICIYVSDARNEFITCKLSTPNPDRVEAFYKEVKAFLVHGLNYYELDFSLLKSAIKGITYEY